MTVDPEPTTQSTVREWSLARVFSRWLILATMVPVLVASVMGVVFLEQSLARELHALVEEELREASLYLKSSSPASPDFKEIAAILADDHPLVVMAWRLFESDSGELLGEFGDKRILTVDAPGSRISPQTTSLVGGQLSRTIDLENGRSLGLILDGTALVASSARYRLITLMVLLLCGVIALVVGRFLASRVTGLLQQVTDSVAIGSSAESPRASIHNAPKEIKAIAGQLHELLDKIHERSEEARTFTMCLAHELRSPVQNLIGQAEVALMTAQDVETSRSILASQLEELVGFGDSIDNVLTLCAQPRRKQDSIENFDLGAEAEIRLTREQLRGRSKSVTVATTSIGDTHIRGDREMILRGLRNVVANAVEWSPDGANVDVRIADEQDSIRVTVDDSGPGLPPELRQSVFEPFFQGPKPTDRRLGFGLGLAMTKRAAERHGGTVTIGESPSGGARFDLTFLRDPPDGAAE